MTRPLLALLAALLMLAGTPSPSPAQGPPPAQLEVGLVSADPEFLFWVGRTAMMAAGGAGSDEERERYLRIAVRAFERILALDPGEVRPRLELARAFFLMGEDSRAREQFEKALAGDLPPAVKGNIAAHLDLMQRRKRWFATLGVALAPDSNIGASDDEDTFHLGPLALRLNDPAEPEAGIGFHTWADFQYFHPLRRNLNWRAAADVSLWDYPNRPFDRLWLGARTGPQVLLGPLALSVLAEAGHTRRADRPESDEFGVRIESSLRLGQRLTLYPQARWIERRYRDIADQDGPHWSAGLSAGFRATPRLTLRGGLRVTGSRPEREDHRSRGRGLDLGASYDFRFGVTAALDASVARTAFEPDWGLLTRGEAKRRDRVRSYRLSLHHRGWKLGGFAPRLSVSREERDSNAQLQDYRRWHGEIALVRRF